MDTAQLFLLVCTAMAFYCTGASWMLQVVCYPTYTLVGEKEFVPFHIDFGRRLMIAAVAPMVLTTIATFVLVFLRPMNTPLWAVLIVALCSLIVLGTTMALEVPKHLKLDREGKSDAVIAGLVRDNIPRVIAWTTASFLLAYVLYTSVQSAS